MPATDVASQNSVEDDLALLREAAGEAGRIAMRYFDKNPEVWMKGGTSPVSEADYAANNFLQETLLKNRPDYGWLSEETTDDLARLTARRTFVVDPIDGTRAFLAGKATWCVSVAVVENGNSLAGVLECPAKQETYWAAKGSGAFLNGAKISVGETSEKPKIAGPKTLIDRLPATLQSQMKTVAYVPSLAYRIALIASGVINASFVKPNSHDWDLAAADLILQEAGGSLFNDKGARPLYATDATRHGALAAGSGKLVEILTGVLSENEG